MQGNRVLIYREGAWQAEELYQWFRTKGFDVSYVPDGEIEGTADLLVLCPDLRGLDALPDGEIGTGHDFDRIGEIVSKSLFAMKRCVEDAVPWLRGGGKRVAFLTKAESSVTLCGGRDHFAEHMLLAGENMLAKMTFNRLRPEGFTVRCFAPSDGLAPGRYILQDFCYDPGEPDIHSEENRLVLRNGGLAELPW